MTESVYVIAEGGVNHNGSLQKAFEIVDAASYAGADAVKFQTFQADRLVTNTAGKAQYQERLTHAEETQFEMLRQLELSDGMHREIMARCASCGLDFLSTPFDGESLRYLIEDLGLRQIKVPSGEITNGPLLLQAAQRADRVILSTGMATLAEIETAVAVLVRGMVDPNTHPVSLSEVLDCYAEHGTDPLKGRVSLLHCTSEYPAAMADVNLRAMDTLSQAFGLDFGLSDHTMGIAAPIAAVARGAILVEKHLTIDRNLPGPDHAASLEPAEMKDMVRSIREIEVALGDGRKRPKGTERANRAAIRKSIVASRLISAGESFTSENMVFKRPGIGLSPMHYWDLKGATASRAFAIDDPIE
ncbi:N-acetylneuraminate synthase [Pelagibius sp.]|uniref:N-acetylneuraminate synthase n=1 Tax=Pelagibius sp. TaxID=1931238 RepID=UPI003B500062